MLFGKDGPALEACLNALNALGRPVAVERTRDFRTETRPSELLVAVLDADELRFAADDGSLGRLAGASPVLAVLPENQLEAAAPYARFVDDFVAMPIRAGEFGHRVDRLLSRATAPGDDRAPDPGSVDEVTRRLTRALATSGLVGRDPRFLQALAMLPTAARSKAPVLIVGETGTGKELCARAIHGLGPRPAGPFVPADCATLPDHLFENEMFGHRSGAYTDARREQKGLVALADGGTLFLDEIDSLSLASQAKLLRLLQERSYRPLGAPTFERMDASILVATNADLEALVRRKQFRADLFFRLSVIRIELLPLRERRSDIPLLARHLLARACADAGLPAATLAAATLRCLTACDWPGNVRELANTLQRAVLMAHDTEILPAHCGLASAADDAPTRASEDCALPLAFREARTRAIESFERQYVAQLMRECRGNVSHAARLAQKERRAFGRLVKRYDIPRG